MKRFFRVIAPFVLIAIILCIPTVTEKLPSPMKEAFTDLRTNAIMLSEGKGYGSIKWSNPRGMWESGPAGPMEKVGGR